MKSSADQGVEEDVDAEGGGVRGLVADGVGRGCLFPAGGQIARAIDHGGGAVDFGGEQFGRGGAAVVELGGERGADFHRGNVVGFAEQRRVGGHRA